MTETSATLVTGGLKTKGGAELPALDGVVAEAASEELANRTEELARVITLLPHEPYKAFIPIDNGTVLKVPQADAQTRRFSAVLTADVVVAISGQVGTRGVIDLAYAAGKPLILLPGTGGETKKAWDQYRQELLRRVPMEKGEIEALEDASNCMRGVDACLSILKRVLRPQCFIAMPFEGDSFDEVFGTIESAVSELGYRPVRVDRENVSGNIIDAIWRAIRECECAVVDLTEHRPNVYYELGIAHALAKPTLLLVRSSNGEIPEVPFDIRVRPILPFDSPDSLKMQIMSKLRALPSRQATPVDLTSS